MMEPEERDRNLSVFADRVKSCVPEGRKICFSPCLAIGVVERGEVWTPLEVYTFEFPGSGAVAYVNRRGEPMRWARDAVARALGERLVGVKNIRDWEQRYRVAIDVPLVAYGDTYLQQWARLRDVLAATREQRRQRRKLAMARDCVICGKRIPRWDRLDAVYFDDATPELLRRFYLIQAWESKSKHRESHYAMKAFSEERDSYWLSTTNRGELVCSAPCEISRFARWLGNLEYRARLRDKRMGAERYERRCLNQARKKLKEVRRYLSNASPEASGSQGGESTPVLNSLSS